MTWAVPGCWMGRSGSSRRPVMMRVSKNGFIPVAKAQGADIVSTYTMANDPNTARTQAAIAVAQFQRDDVETVYTDVGGDPGLAFMNAAESQGALWNYEGGCCIGDFKQAPEAIWGAHFLQSFHSNEQAVGIPADKVETDCISAYLGRSYSTKFDRDNRADGAYGFASANCALVQVFADAAMAAGPNLTRDGLAAALQTLPPKQYPYVVGPMTFRGYNDGADYHRVLVLDEECGCPVPVNADMIPNKY